MTPQSIIPEVRTLIKDADATAYRNQDADITAAINRAVKRIALVRPDLFTTITTMPLVAGVLQTVPNFGRIMEVFGVTGGNTVTEANREILDDLTPTWRSATAGTPSNWMRHSRDPNRFFVSPPSNGVGSLDVEYTIAPATYAIADAIALQETYQPVVVDMTVAEIEWADDENVLNQRADVFYRRAVSALTGAMQERALTDTEKGGIQGAID